MITAGIGVIRSVLIKVNTSGMWPSRPPTKNNLDHELQIRLDNLTETNQIKNKFSTWKTLK